MTTPNRRAVFPGSFDPPTNGHLDIIRRCLGLFDEVTVALLDNPSKTPLFSIDERQRFILREFSEGTALRVRSFSGLLVEFAHQLGATVVVRGIRSASDYEYEAQMAQMNRALYPSLETLLLVAREEYAFVSSSLVKQVALLGGDVSQFVPEEVCKALHALPRLSSSGR